MLFYLTDMFLDVVWGTAFWIVKKTAGGAYYLVWGDGTTLAIKDKEYETIVLSKENIEADDQIKELLEKTSKQEEQIAKLTESIKELSDIIRNDYIK